MCCDVEKPYYRFLILFFNCLLTFGSYYCFDMPSVLQNQMTTDFNCNNTENVTCCHDCLGMTPSQYNLLYAVYSWTNAFVVIGAGFFIDKFGNQIGALLFSSLCVIGSSIFALGAFYRGTENLVPLMLLGRLIFGAGNGSLTIVQNRITSFWFSGKELALAFGVTLAFSRLGSVLNFFLTGTLSKAVGLQSTFWIGAGLCGLGFIAAITVGVLDVYGFKRRGMLDRIHSASKNVSVRDVSQFSKSYWFLVITIMFFYNGVFPFVADARADWNVFPINIGSNCSVWYTNGSKLNNSIGARVSCPGKDFRFSYPLDKHATVLQTEIFAILMCCIVLMTFTIVIFLFVQMNIKFIKDKYKFNDTAPYIAGAVYDVSLLLSPFLGGLIDVFGKRGILTIACAVGTIPVFGLLAFSNVHPLVSTLWLGVTYSVAAASMWPSIPLIVSQATIGTAMGIATSVQMIGIGFSNLIVGEILGTKEDIPIEVTLLRWKYVMIYLLANALACVATATTLYFIDKRKDGVLDMSRKEAREKAENEGVINADTKALVDALEESSESNRESNKY